LRCAGDKHKGHGGTQRGRGRGKGKEKEKKVSHGGTEAQGKRERSERRKESGLDGIGEKRWWLVVGGWWLVVGGWWLVVGGWWLVVGGWWLVVGGWPMRRLKGLLVGCFGFFKNC
jgi:hypothetical protein